MMCRLQQKLNTRSGFHCLRDSFGILSFQFAVVLLLNATQVLHAQDLAVYRLTWRELEKSKKQIAFVSLSDSYRLSEHPDSLAVPYIGDMPPATAEYFQLTGTYRARFLAGTHVTEADRVFMYDYSKDILLTFLVKDLQVMACLSIYVGQSDWPYSIWDYQIGFNIPTFYLKEFASYYRHVYVCVGRVNPFVQGQMKPIVWKKAPPVAGPGSDTTFVDTTWGRNLKYGLGETHQYESLGYRYRVQDLLLQGRMSGRLLQVYEKATRALVCQRVFHGSESTSPAPLNLVHPDEDSDLNQWAGKLFRTKPPVVFGFNYISFGCEGIDFLDPTEPPIWVRCDNRH